MRREKRRRMEEMGIDFKKISYIAGSILSVAVIAFVVTFFVYGNQLKKNTTLAKKNSSIIDSYNTLENSEETSFSIGKTINEVEHNEIEESNTIENSNTTKYAVNTSHIEELTETSNQNVIETEEDDTDTDSEETIETKEDTKNEDETPKEEKIKDPEFVMPVKGEIVAEFAKDKLIYSNTLGEWVTHKGIDIQAEKATVVKASAEGTVKSIKNDPRYGLTVVVEHVNGYTSVYANLLTAEFVVVGEKLKSGQTIGTVGNTATFEIADEPHLHFEITKDGENLDPELYIKK